MIDKFKDLKDAYGDTVGSVMKIIVTIGSLLVVCGLVFGWFEKGLSEDSGSNETSDIYLGMYTVLNETVSGLGKNKGLKKEILLLDPFLTESDFDGIVSFLINNDKKMFKEVNKVNVNNIEYSFYTREVNYLDGLAPVGVATYGHQKGIENNLDKKPNYSNYVTKKNMFYYNSENKEDYLTGEAYEDFKGMLKMTELIGGNHEVGVEYFLVFYKGLNREADTFYDKNKKTFSELIQQFENGEQSNLYEGTGPYLRELIEETDKPLYDFITNL